MPSQACEGSLCEAEASVDNVNQLFSTKALMSVELVDLPFKNPRRNLEINVVVK